MNDNELEYVVSLVTKAKRCEDVFGAITGDSQECLNQISRTYHRLAKVMHEDRVPDALKPTVKEAWLKLQDFKAFAVERVKHGTYGTITVDAVKPAATTFTVVTKKNTYVVEEPLRSGDVADLYWCRDTARDERVILKVARDSRNNDLIEREATTLRVLNAATKHTKVVRFFLPTLLESTTLPDKRRANVLDCTLAAVPLAELRTRGGRPLDPRHAVWMLNRGLVVLEATHANGIIHGAVTPSHLVITAANHGAQLIGWGHSVEVGKRISVLSSPWKDLYAPEVLLKQPATPAVDVFMLARSLIYVMGPDWKRTTPFGMQTFLESMCILNPARRARDVTELYEHWRVLQKKIYETRFVPLELEAVK